MDTLFAPCLYIVHTFLPPNLWTMDKMLVPNVSIIWRFHCIPTHTNKHTQKTQSYINSYLEEAASWHYSTQQVPETMQWKKELCSEILQKCKQFPTKAFMKSPEHTQNALSSRASPFTYVCVQSICLCVCVCSPRSPPLSFSQFLSSSDSVSFF